MDPVSVLDYRYGTEEMRNIFRANSYLNYLLKVEATLAEAQSEIGIVPKKAAAEMRERIISALQSAKEPEPDTAHKKQTWRLATQALHRDQAMNWNILDNPNRLRIMTIDALSFHINQMAPLLGELGCQPEIIDKPQTLYREAAIHILTEAKRNGIATPVKQLLLQTLKILWVLN